jgi:formiminotetrahydrofolate cyclodeaminase
MDKKKKSSKNEDQQFQYNLQEVEKCSLSFLSLACEFYDIYQNVKTNMQNDIERKVPLDKKTRRKSIQNVLRNSFLKPSKTQKLNFNKKPEFEEDSINAGDISFMIEDEPRTSNFNSISKFIKEGLGNEELNQTIAFMSSEDEADEHEIKGFAQQINTEFLRKDLYEIWKDFNDIAILLFSKNLKDCVISYRKSSSKFFQEHFKSKMKHGDTQANMENYNSEFSNRILSESMNYGTSDFRRMGTQCEPSKETQINLELAKMYRNQSADKRDRWIEFVFWGFLVSSILILVIFFVLFYCNVFSSKS